MQHNSETTTSRQNNCYTAVAVGRLSLPFLKARDAFRLRRVCSSWNNAVCSNVGTLRLDQLVSPYQLALVHHIPKELEMCLCTVATTALYKIKKINLGSWAFDLDDRFFTLISKWMPEVEAIYAPMSSLTSTFITLSNLRKLRALRFSPDDIQKILIRSFVEANDVELDLTEYHNILEEEDFASWKLTSVEFKRNGSQLGFRVGGQQMPEFTKNAFLSHIGQLATLTRLKVNMYSFNVEYTRNFSKMMMTAAFRLKQLTIECDRFPRLVNSQSISQLVCFNVTVTSHSGLRRLCRVLIELRCLQRLKIRVVSEDNFMRLEQIVRYIPPSVHRLTVTGQLMEKPMAYDDLLLRNFSSRNVVSLDLGRDTCSNLPLLSKIFPKLKRLTIDTIWYKPTFSFLDGMHLEYLKVTEISPKSFSTLFDFSVEQLAFHMVEGLVSSLIDLPDSLSTFPCHLVYLSVMTRPHLTDKTKQLFIALEKIVKSSRFLQELWLESELSFYRLEWLNYCHHLRYVGMRGSAVLPRIDNFDTIIDHRRQLLKQEECLNFLTISLPSTCYQSELVLDQPSGPGPVTTTFGSDAMISFVQL